MSKKILAILLSLSMIGSAVSMPVFADEIEAETAEVTETVEEEETEEVSIPYSEDEIVSKESENIEDEADEFVDDSIEVASVSLMATAETTTYTFEKNQTFVFENIGIIAYDITGLSNYIDYAIYYKDGSVQSYNWNQRPGTLSIPAGGKAIITSTSGTVKAVLADEYFLVEEQDNPVMNKSVIGVYETYTYTNTSNVAFNLLITYSSSSSYYYDYILYDASGNVNNYEYHKRGSTIEVPAGYSIKVTPTNYSMTFNGLYDKFTLEKNDTPAMKKVVISPGQTYTYSNISNIAYNLFMTYSSASNYYYDYVMYDTDGNVTQYEFNKKGSIIEVPAGYSIKVTPTNYTMTFNGIFEKFNVQQNNTPAMKKTVISVGESYVYTNISNVSYNLFMTYSSSSSYYYDYVLYDTNGNIAQYEYNKRGSTIEVPAGYSIKVTPTNYTMTFNGIYEKFNLEKDDTPVMKKAVVSAGETYTYINTSDATYNLLPYSGNGFNYISYYSNDKVKATESNIRTSTVAIPGGGKIKVTPTYYTTTFNGLYEIFDVEDTVSEKQSYKYINTGNIDTVLNYKSGNSGDYAVYDAENNLSYYGVATNDKITIPKGGYAIVTLNTTSNSPFEDNAEITTEERTNPVYRTTYLNAGETYKYTNNASRELKVFKNGLSCDYVIYNADGSIASYAANSTDSSLTVPIGGSICITSHVYLNIKGLYDNFSVQKINISVFNIVSCRLGETYQYVNNAVKDINLLLSNSRYDYVIYNADGSVYSIKMNASDNSITVPAGSKCAITPQVSNIDIRALNEAFTSSKRSYPVLKRASVYFGEKITMTNTSDEDRTLYSSTSNYIDYATYDSNANPQTAKEFVNPSSIIVPSGGKVEITARFSNETFGGLYEAFTDEDLSVSVMGVELSQSALTLSPNKQAILKATVMPSDATNKNVSWSSSNSSVATVAQTGKVTAKAVGTATITATTADGGYTASCVVTVSDGTTPIETTKPTETPDTPVTDGAVVKVSSVTASAGNTVNVTVDLSGNKGFANLGIQVGYDANNLTLTSVTNNASVGATYTGAQSITANPYNMGWDSTNNITYNGNLATLTFKVKENAAEGKYPITVSYYKGISGNYTDGEDVNYDADFNSLNLNYVNGAITVSSHIAGDINGDGKVNNQDGTFLLRHLAGWNVNIDESALDVNGDGRVNNQDGTVLLRYLAGWSVTIH